MPRFRRPATKSRCGGRIRRAVRVAFSAGAALALLACGACHNLVIVGPPPREPASIFVADYGHHASLVLPLPDGELAEYAYGEWEWFARGRTEWTRGVAVLCVPGKATLGSRLLGEAAPVDELRQRIGARRVTAFHVEREAALSLSDALQRRMRDGAADRVHNPALGLDFVPHPQPYCALRQCNSTVADWLRQLGLRVIGLGVSSRFETTRPVSPTEE